MMHASKVYNLTTNKGKIICNSQSALFQAKHRRRRAWPGTDQADVFRTLRPSHQRVLATDLGYEWVKSHQVNTKAWQALSLEEQLNVSCDSLANSAIERAMSTHGQPVKTRTLPFKKVTIMIQSTKITLNIAQAIRFTLGQEEAQRFYTKAQDNFRGSNKGGLGWTQEAFNAVDWSALDQLLQSRMAGFQLWLSKQAIGVCATQKNTLSIQDILDNCCPYCGKHGEGNRHLN
jgi:hypothetical protein